MYLYLTSEIRLQRIACIARLCQAPSLTFLDITIFKDLSVTLAGTNCFFFIQHKYSRARAESHKVSGITTVKSPFLVHKTLSKIEIRKKAQKNKKTKYSEKIKKKGNNYTKLGVGCLSVLLEFVIVV